MSCCTAAQNDYIRNFQAKKSSTHITFSWDIVDGYSRNITYFQVFYRYRTSPYFGALYISYNSATRSGTTFSYTRQLETFNDGPYIMWVQVYRRFLDPRYTYSERKYVSIGKLDLETT